MLKYWLENENKKCEFLMQPSNAPRCCSRHSGLVQGWWSISWVDFDVTLSFPAAQPILPNSQNLAEGRSAKIKVNPTQLSEHMDNPVQCDHGGQQLRFVDYDLVVTTICPIVLGQPEIGQIWHSSWAT